jgi:hypothetical protein
MVGTERQISLGKMLRTPCRYGRGVNGFHINEASEVLLIEGQNALHSMHSHRGNQARIVNPNP